MQKDELKSPENKTHGISEARTAAGTTAARNPNQDDT